MTTKERTCEERIDEELKSRIEDFRNALKGKYEDYKYEDQIEWLNSYALAYNDDPHARAKRLELSYGGPQDYFLFFEDETIEYHFLDWFDGAKKELEGEDYKTMKDFFDSYLDI